MSVVPRKRQKFDEHYLAPLERDEDLFLVDLAERFQTFCYPPTDEDSQSPSMDDLLRRLDDHNLEYRSSIQLNFQTLQQECLDNEQKLSDSKAIVDQLRQTLVERQAYLKLAKSKRRHQADYSIMANVIERIPSRTNSLKRLNLLTTECEQQKVELTHINQRLNAYQKQSKVVLYSLLELVGFIDVKLPINFEDEIGRLDSNHLQDGIGEKS